MWSSSAVYFAMSGSLMVSYVRARVEGLGGECNAGFMQRPERVIAVGVGALVGVTGLKVAVWAIAVLANVTAMERVRHFRKQSRP